MFASRNHNQAKQPEGRRPEGGGSTPDRKTASQHNPIWQSLAMRSGVLQTKLTISQDDDPYEREADRVANQVMRMPAPQSTDAGLSITPVTARRAQRKCAECEEDEEEGKLQRKENGGAEAPATAPPIVHQTLNSPGQPLDAATRAFFEPRFGRDFSHVRVHRGSETDVATEQLSAIAFTHGQHMYFRAGSYAPDQTEGRRLLAHELAHTVQQSGDSSAPAILRARAPKPSVCEPSDLYAKDVGTLAHTEIQKAFLNWCGNGGHFCEVEQRIPGASKSGNTGRADLAQLIVGDRSMAPTKPKNWQLGEIKPVTWLNRGQHAEAVLQLGRYIGAKKAMGEGAVSMTSFVPPSPVTECFHGNCMLKLYSTVSQEGIYYYWCELDQGEDDEQRARQQEAGVLVGEGTEVDFSIDFLIVNELVAPLEDERIPITAELRRLGPRTAGDEYVLVATQGFFERLVLEPMAERQSQPMEVTPPGQRDPGLGMLNATALPVGAGAALLALGAGVLMIGDVIVVLLTPAAVYLPPAGGELVFLHAVATAPEVQKAAGVLLVAAVLAPDSASAAGPRIVSVETLQALPVASLDSGERPSLFDQVTVNGVTRYVAGFAKAGK